MWHLQLEATADVFKVANGLEQVQAAADATHVLDDDVLCLICTGAAPAQPLFNDADVSSIKQIWFKCT